MRAESSSLTLKLDLTACCLAVFREGIRNLPVCCRGFAITIPARNASGLDASATVLQTLPFLCSSGCHLDASNIGGPKLPAPSSALLVRRFRVGNVSV